MQLKHNIPLLFKLTFGMLAFVALSWMVDSKYSVSNDFRIKSPLKLDSNGSLDHSTPHRITDYEKQSSKNNTNPQSLSHSDVLSSSSENARKNSQMEEGSSQGAKKETKLNNKDIDEKVRKSEVENLVSIISRLSNIDKKSSIMALMRKTLNHLSHIPSLPPDLIKKSKGSLLPTVVPPEARVTYSDTWNGYRLPIITCVPNGRLGNVMGEYATMYAIQQLYNVSVVVNVIMSEKLSHFPRLSLTKLTGKYSGSQWIEVSRYGSRNNYSPIELAASGLLGPSRFAMKEYAFEIQLFQKYKEDIKQEFTFSNDITTKVQTFLKSVAENRSKTSHSDIVFVGFHVRRTDYSNLAKKYGGTLPGDSYFNRAMDYFRNKFPDRVVFIASSDNHTFIKKKIGAHSDVIFSPGTSAPLDMALLSSCNHSIITLGSYGFWTGFLAGGEVVYPNTKFTKEFRFSQVMYEKAGLASFTPLPVD